LDFFEHLLRDHFLLDPEYATKLRAVSPCRMFLPTFLLILLQNSLEQYE